MQKTSDRLWSRDFILNLVTAHFLFASYSLLYTVVPLYILFLQGREWHVGIIVGALGLAGIFVRPLSGRGIHRLGPKRVVMMGLAVFAAGSLLFVPAGGVWWLLPARLLQGIGMGMCPVATSTIVANLAPERRRAEGVGYMGNSIALSLIYGPMLGFWLYTTVGFQATFVSAAVCAALGLLSSSLMSVACRGPVEVQAGPNVPLINRKALFPALVFLSYTLCQAPVTTFLPLLADDRSLGNPGLYFSVNSTTALIFMLISGRVADRLGRPFVIVPGLLITALSMFCLSIALNQFMFLASAFLMGSGFGLLQPGMQALTVDRVSSRERSSALATLQQAWDIGGSGGSFALGAIAGVVGIGATFSISGIGAMVGAMGFVWGNNRYRICPDRERRR